MIFRENRFELDKDPAIPWSHIIGDNNFEIPPKTQGFRVFKLNYDTQGHPQWVDIFDLGDRILFVSEAVNKLISVNDYDLQE